MKTKLIILSIIVLTFFGNVSCNSNKQSAENTIKIGAILPLTGKYSVIGEGEKKGIELALDSLKNKYPNTKVEVIYEDFASETKNAVTAANKLISIEKVNAIITSTTAACEAVSPVVQNAKKINFVISPDIDIVNKSNYNYRVYYNLNTESKVVEDFVNRNKPNNVAFLVSRYPSLQKLVDDKLAPFFKNSNINILSKNYVEVTDNDFKNVILKIKDQNPSLIFLAPMTNQVDLFTNQLSQYDVKPSNKLMIIGSFTFNWKPKDFINTLEGYYIATPAFQIKDGNNWFTELYKKKYNSNPSFDIAYAYDNVLILSDLLFKSKGDAKTFKDEFNSLGEFNGASGKIKFIGNNETDAEIVMTQIENGNQIVK